MKRHFYLLLCYLITIFLFTACNKNITSDNEEAPVASTDITNISENEVSIKPTEKVKEEKEAMNTEAATVNESKEEGEHFIKTTFTSKALQSAKDGSSNEKKLLIYLPPDYYKSEQKYPVIYYFHGFGDSMTFITNNKKAFDTNMVLPENKEFIVVEVDGSRASTSEGSFWVNSTVTGQWEDYIIQEIVPYIDENYRTLAKPEARGIVGYSMGGFASINLALAHPDVFSSTLSFCPGILKEGSMQLAMESWKNDGTFLRCYGQSFAPNEAKDNMCDIPTLDGTAEDNIIVEKWESGFSNFNEKLDNYLAKNMPLKAIQVVYGTYDYYKWIIEGCEDLSELMTEKGIEHTLTPLKVGHNPPSEYISDYIVPFFSTNLDFNN
jgi:enterochelin esterase-like enzyme